jgi:hypothetical protein
MVLRKIFALQRKEVTGDWRKLRIEELHDVYCSLNIIWVSKSRIMKCVGHVAYTGEKRNAYRVLVGKTEGKTPLERPRCKWEDNIKIYNFFNNKTN